MKHAYNPRTALPLVIMHVPDLMEANQLIGLDNDQAFGSNARAYGGSSMAFGNNAKASKGGAVAG